MVSTRGLRYKFSEGERVLCYEPDPTKAKVLYDSKVLEVIESKDKRGRRTVEYLIHFQGWNSSWDRCVSEDFILKDSQENRQLQRDLAEKSQLQLGAYLYRREPKKRVNTTAHPGPAKRARHGCSDAGSSTSTQPDEVEPGDTDSSSGSATSSGSDSGNNSSGSQERLQCKPPAFKADIPIPPALRDRLTFDYHLVVKRGRLSRLPASPCAAEILESFVKWFAHTGVWQAARTRHAPHAPHAPAQRPDIPDVSCRLHLVREVAEGIRIYIDFVLGDHLLYRQEQNQYWQICGQYNEDVKPKSESEESQEEDTAATDEERNSPKMPEYSHLPPDPVRNQNDKQNDTENDDETEDDEEDDGDNDDEEDDEDQENTLHNNVENHSHGSETEDDDDEMENDAEQDESDVQDNGENDENTEHNNIENEVNNVQDDTENEDDDGHSNEENDEESVLHNNVVNLVQNAIHNIENERGDSADSNEDNDEDSVNNDAENENYVHNNVGNNDTDIHNNGQNVPNNIDDDENEGQNVPNNVDNDENSEEDNEHHNGENGDDSLQNDVEEMENEVNRQNEIEQNNEEDDGQNAEDDDEEMDVDDVGENDEDNGGENDGENDQENYEDEDSKSKVMESIDGRNSYNYATSSSDPNNECDGEDVKVKVEVEVEVKVERVKVEASSEEVEPCEEGRPRARRARCAARSGHYARRLRSYKSNKSHSESEEQAPSTSTGGEQRPFDTQSSSVESTMSSLSGEWCGGAGRAPPAPPSPPSPPTLKRTPLSLLLEKVSKWRVIPRDESTKHLPCRIYGATHLARLFVKLPEFLNATNMAESKLKIILKNIDMFVQYLDQHGEWFGEVHYMSDGRSDSH